MNKIYENVPKENMYKWTQPDTEIKQWFWIVMDIVWEKNSKFLFVLIYNSKKFVFFLISWGETGGTWNERWKCG